MNTQFQPVAAQTESARADSVQRRVRPIAVLCANPNSAYATLAGVEVFDKKRDARTFQGHMPAIGHPPCRAWSAHCAHQAKPEPGEKELGLWCAEQVKQWGGILEQPANSKLWEAARLPKPGWTKTKL